MPNPPAYRLSLRMILFLLLCMPGGIVLAQRKDLTEEQRITFERIYMTGAKEKVLENTDEAIKQFRACLAIDPTNAAVYYNLGELYLDKKLYVDAQTNVLKAIELDKENIWYHKLLRDVYEGMNDHAKAADIEYYISTREEELPNLLRASYLYAMARDFKKSIAMLDKAEKKAGITEEITRQKEQIYLALGKPDKAIKELEKLSKAYPTNMRYLGMLADIYNISGKSEKAIKLYQEILEKEPKNGYAAFAMSDYYKEKGDKEQWFQLLKKGMGSNDVAVKSKLQMIVSFISEKAFENNIERSHELADAFITASPDEPAAYLVKGDLYTEQRDYEQAYLQYYKAAHLDPSALMAWRQMIFCSAQLLNNERLQRDCAEAITYFPNEVLFYFYHAVASNQLKQYEQAVASARSGIELSEDNPEMKIQLYSTMGDAFHYLKRREACDSAYGEALRLDSNNAYALNNYAYFLSLRKEQLPRAEAMSKRSLELDPGNASYFDTYGWILYQQKDYLKAKEYIEKSLAIVPNNAEVIEHLGDVLYRLNEKEDALKYWKKAKELGSQTEFLDRKITDGKLYE